MKTPSSHRQSPSPRASYMRELGRQTNRSITKGHGHTLSEGILIGLLVPPPSAPAEAETVRGY